MTRLRNLVVVLVVLAVVASACGGSAAGSAPAATVNGVDLSDADFVDTLRTFNEHSEFAQQLVGIPVHADGDAAADRVDATFAAGVLELSIILELLDQELDERGLELTQEDRDAITAQFDPTLTAQLDELPDDVEQWFIDWNAKILVLRDDLAEGLDSEVTDDAVRAFYDDNIAQFENQVCAQHVLLENEEDAEDVLAELEGGADFATVAEERSIDPSAASNGGDLGCTSADRYVEEFAEAITEGEIGEHLGPVETQFGFHVIEVLPPAPLEDVREEIEQGLADQAGAAELQALQADLIAEADVEVNPRFGRWDPQTGQVVPADPLGDVRPVDPAQDALDEPTG